MEKSLYAQLLDIFYIKEPFVKYLKINIVKDSMIELEWIKSGGKEKGNFKSNSSILSIGRNRINDIILHDDRVSAFHAAIIENEKGDFFVRDLGSLNGVAVNGDNCYRRILRENDVINILDYHIKVKNILKDNKSYETHKNEILLHNSMEIPITDTVEKPIMNRYCTTTTYDVLNKSGSLENSQKDLFHILKELITIKEFSPLTAQLLTETCKNIFRTKSGYIALIDDSKRLLLRHKIGISDFEIPPVSKKIYHTVIEEKKVCFLEMAKNIRVAAVPIKDTKCVIGLMYLYNIPEDSYNETNKRLIESLVENEQFRKHITECYSRSTDNPVSLSEGFFKWKEKFVGNKKIESMCDIYQKLERIGNSDMHIVLLGDKGTGKTYLAHMIHKMSAKRKDNNFVVVDLNAIPETLIESELFGTTKGAFPSSVDRIGYFEFANGGTIFFDEIGDISKDIQSKIRTVIDTKTIRRIGSVKEILVDVRIIAATNKDLDSLIKDGSFREDLYDRLGGNLSTIKIPPLKERKDDVMLLANFFIDESDILDHMEGISRNAAKALMNYEWTGNIRMLRDVIKLAAEIANSEGRRIISESDLPQYITEGIVEEEHKSTSDHFPSLEEVEKEHIQKAMEKTNWNKSMAAELLGLSRPTLNEKLKKYGIEKKVT